MPDSTSCPNETEIKIREMLLEMGDEELLAQFDRAVKASNERHRRIDKTLEELMSEVDELLLRMDALEAGEESPNDDEISENAENGSNKLC